MLPKDKEDKAKTAGEKPGADGDSAYAVSKDCPQNQHGWWIMVLQTM